MRAHMPYSITAHVYMRSDLKQPAWTDKSTKKGKLPMEHTSLGELTETLGHAWQRVRPNTYLLLTYKRRARGPIWKRKNIAKKLCPFAYSHSPNHLAILVPEERQNKEVGGQLKRSLGSGSWSGVQSQIFVS
jgi:hypothetical protein